MAEKSKVKKIKAYELANELGVGFKDFKEILIGHSIMIKAAISPLDQELVEKIKNIFKAKKEKVIEDQKKEESKKVVQQQTAPVAPPPILKETAVEQPQTLRPSIYDKLLQPEKTVAPKYRPKGKPKVKEGMPKVEKPVTIPKEIEIETPISIKDFSVKTGIKTSLIIKKLLDNGYLYTINDYLNDETTTLLGLEFGIEIKLKRVTENVEEYLQKLESIIPEDAQLMPKPPVVVVLGHVDHGKTTLLDRIRKTNIAQKEAGGITQHIGAYKVFYNDRQITFLDTPGHEAFTALRARGAHITDIAVLVVAADDGVMPQTIEAYNHAKEANIPIIVAINKIDKKEANPHRVKLQLSKYDIIPDEWGGDTMFVELSALTGFNIEKLLEAILIQADILNKKAPVNKLAIGYVIESRMSPSMGIEATLLIEQGTLKKGDSILCGSSYGKVRAIYDDRGKSLEMASLSDSVRVIGLTTLPKAGEKFYCIESFNKAKELAEIILNYEKAKKLSMKKHTTLGEIYKKIEEKKLKVLKIILKTDVLGSMEVLKYSLENMKFKEVTVQVIHSGVGIVSESDVLLADASDAIILRFNVGIEERASTLAKERGIEIRYYTVIYDMINDVKSALEGLLAPKFEEVLTGKCIVKATFKISRYGVVAGCEVKSGKITNKSKLKVFRNSQMIFEGYIESLKRFKEDVKEVEQGLECGVKIKDFDGIEVGDEIEAFEIVEVKQKLE